MSRFTRRAGVLAARAPSPPSGAYPVFSHLTATDFGAVGDGATDNQTALMAAFAAAKAQHLPLYLPPGTYNHSGKLTLDSAVLFGESSTTTHLHGTTYANHALYLQGTAPQVHGIKKSGTSRSPRSSNREGNGIYVINASGYVIRNCHILNVDGAGLMTEFATFGLERNNLVELTGADGMYHTEASHDIENCYNRTVETGDDAISWTTYGGRWVYNLNIHHNTSVGNYQSRVHTVNGTSGGVVIHDNHIDGGTAGISIVAYSGWSSSAQNVGVEAYGNTIRNINQTLQNTGTIGGGAIAFWNNNAGTDTGLNLHDNVVYNPGLYGIYVGGAGVINATVSNTPFYLGSKTLYRSDDPAATVTRTNLTSLAVTAYPGDLVPATVGGLDPTYLYTP